MLDIGVASYFTAALLFLVLSILLLTSWRGRLQGALLVGACGATVLWAAVVAFSAAWGYPASLLVPSLEITRNAVWFAFLIRLLHPVEIAAAMATRLKILTAAVLGVCVVLLAMLYGGGGSYLTVFGQVFLSIIGLGLVEQVYRNTVPERRWALKFLCLGIGGMFAYDLFLYSDALLLQRIDMDLWNARGMITALVVPLIALSAARNPQWSLDVFVSRGIVFHTAALMGAGLYLLVMAAAGYYIRLYGGTWGTAAQVIFLFGAAVILLIVIASGRARAGAKVFFNKHFFSHKYDYREEWLRFIRTLAGGEAGQPLSSIPGRERAIQALAQIVDSPAGLAWWRQDKDMMTPSSVDGASPFVLLARWNVGQHVAVRDTESGSLMRFLDARQWIIDLEQYAKTPDFYTGLDLPQWLSELGAMPQGAWLVIPLISHQRVMGFMVLMQPRAARAINWEDRDLLKTAGCQAASYIAQLEATQALVHARQFEAFNRLSAFVVHDLKNLVAQLTLVVSNAAKHKNNPAFMEDAINTVENATLKMNRLLAQLRAGSVRPHTVRQLLDLDALLREVVATRAHVKPVPELQCAGNRLRIQADRDRLAAVFGHIIQNAQDATPPEGYVKVRLYSAGHDADNSGAGQAVLEVEDNGHGMDAKFIRERLFQPFQTTKGNAGMGIGVYQSREVVRELGGDVDVVSEIGKGTLFRVRIPLDLATLVNG